MTLIIDVDMLLYAAAQASEFSTLWDDVNYFLTSNIEEAKSLIAERILQNEQRFGSDLTMSSNSQLSSCFAEPEEPASLTIKSMPLGKRTAD